MGDKTLQIPETNDACRRLFEDHHHGLPLLRETIDGKIAPFYVNKETQQQWETWQVVWNTQKSKIEDLEDEILALRVILAQSEMALQPFAEDPQSPALKNAPCHNNLCSIEKCGRCGRGIAAFHALQSIQSVLKPKKQEIPLLLQKA
jgi:hypothetical protein